MHHEKHKESWAFISSAAPWELSLVNSQTPVSSGEAAGESRLKQHSPLMAFIRAALDAQYSSTPPHHAHSSRTAPQLPIVQQRSFNQPHYHTSSPTDLQHFILPGWLQVCFYTSFFIIIFQRFYPLQTQLGFEEPDTDIDNYIRN